MFGFCCHGDRLRGSICSGLIGDTIKGDLLSQVAMVTMSEGIACQRSHDVNSSLRLDASGQL